ncbi:MAG: helix-turn-helix domain-containing protein [Defluviitaleaceae bacterium]|nr:helix-turn-helix domain-containing protein [Defluviitaleaceae bacterium]
METKNDTNVNENETSTPVAAKEVRTQSNPKPNEYMADRCVIFGQNLRFARRDRGFTTESFANFMDISTTYVGLMERGERCPSLETFLRICEFFGHTCDEMLSAKTEKSNASVGEKTSANQEGSRRKSKKNHEDKVRIIMGMTKTFSAHELELIISVMKSMKSHFSKKVVDDVSTEFGQEHNFIEE